MKKKLTRNILLFFSPAVILCTTAKASENEKLFGIQLNPLFGARVIRHQEAFAEFEATLARLQQIIRETPYQQEEKKEQGKIDDEPEVLQPDSTHQIPFLEKISSYLKPKNYFYTKNFNEKN